MTEYTIVNGKPVAKGKGKKPINLKEVVKNLATFNLVPIINKSIKKKKIKKLIKKAKTLAKKEETGQTGGPAGGGRYYTDAAKDLGKSKAPPDDTPPDRPKAVWVSKGGPIRKNKGGPVDARKIAKKYFKGTF